MAENHTPTIGLNQYSGTDYFMREDFNADNMKIDEAIKELRNSPTKIKLREFVLEQEATLLHIDLSDLDFTEYDYIHIDEEHNAKIFIRIDAEENKSGTSRSLNTASNSYDTSTGTISAHSYFGRFTMYIHHCTQTRSALTTSDNSYQDICYGTATIPWAQAKGVYYKCTTNNNKFPVGYKITIWGEK